MRYVILRDDDTNALTPPECLETLYRPFLQKNLPVNLAAIPAVDTAAVMANGEREGFLAFAADAPKRRVPLKENRELVRYLRGNPGFRIVQHGCFHDYCEFDRADAAEIGDRLDQGARHLAEAGFNRPAAFVAPHDKLSRTSMREVARRFQVVSTGWFELRRLPWDWWPAYAWKKIAKREHWRAGKTLLLSHPGCLLSCHRPYEQMLERILQRLSDAPLTVLVTHWWEYFRGGQPDKRFIGFLHDTADFLSGHPDLKVISFEDLPGSSIPLN